jgi:hypothetical protein
MVPIEQKDWTRRRGAAGLPTSASGTSYSVREAEEALILRPSAIPSFFEIKESGEVCTLSEKNLIVIF